MTDLNDISRMGMRPWHLHNTGGNLVLCAGDGGVCHMHDVVAEPPSDARMGDDFAGRRKVARERFGRIIACVNACGGIPEPDGVRRALEVLWEMAEDEEHEGHVGAREALFEMGFFQDEEQIAGVVMGEEKEE